MNSNEVYTAPTTLLGHPLTKVQQVYCYYLAPTIINALLYIFHFAFDTTLSCQHYREGNPIWASLTILFMYAPAIAGFVFTVSDTEAWPDETGFGSKNIQWALIRIVQHLLFPVWAMYRFAERLFWSIEATRCPEDEQDEIIERANRPSAAELYFFLQAYLQAAPQILLQIYILIRNASDLAGQTIDVQILSVTSSLVKMSITTMSYQRIKTQKIAGKRYPWNKTPSINPEPVPLADPTESAPESESTDVIRRVGPSVRQAESIVDAPPRLVLQESLELPRRKIPIRGLPEDDGTGKLIAFFWWFCFLLPRMLAISAFGYFYPKEIIWVMVSHYIIMLAFTLYDARIDNIPYARLPFILFLAWVYLFCLIEFKIKFKKTRFIYNGYFILVYLENFLMTYFCFVYITFDLELWWHDFVYYTIIGGSVLSLMSMLFYLKVLKPKKVIVYTIIRDSTLK